MKACTIYAEPMGAQYPNNLLLFCISAGAETGLEHSGNNPLPCDSQTDTFTYSLGRNREQSVEITLELLLFVDRVGLAEMTGWTPLWPGFSSGNHFLEVMIDAISLAFQLLCGPLP